ncbi:cytochrome o ubiquinol oxidase subunit IV [Qipengyuania sp. GH25]|uniref:Cytochrome bo(3) ubiquinol oxidase subunit 4 n=2 Tax=Qipengyuania pacifica TaxID=2860199 RepID=A0ABS7JK87_9SPHN|nr:cytochrome o ubiquinol oxidase subunit IV [Qipengyuania aerophila]
MVSLSFEDRKDASRSYIIGLCLSGVLTIIPFALVMGEAPIAKVWLAFTVVLAALVQIVVHIHYFLHVTTKTHGGWSLITTIFTVVILAIMIAGSLWIMYHLNTNMMPGMMTGTSVPTSEPASF